MPRCRPGTAKIGQQQVGGGAVAIAYRRIAKLPDRHPGLNVLLGHREIDRMSSLV